MDKILFDDLVPPLKYFPIKVGKAEIILKKNHFNGDCFVLMYDGLQWCVFNTEEPMQYTELKELFFDINLSRGKVVTTGLGFGMLQTSLCLKPDVNQVIVYEKYDDIIKMFLTIAKESNFDISKLKIINKDAKESVKEKCDWLCMDHFELVHQTLWEVIDEVRQLSEKSKAKNIMFWPIHVAFIDFCAKKQLKFDNNSYLIFRKMIKIRGLPEKINPQIFEKFEYFIKLRFLRQLAFSEHLLKQNINK